MRKSVNEREKITIFAGDLSYFANEQVLADLFVRSGFQVLSVKMGKSRAGDSLQYGFVQVPASTASTALDALNGAMLQGRRIRLSFAGTEDVNEQRQSWVQVHMSFTLFSIEFQLNEEYFEGLFSRFGSVADTTIKQYTTHKRPPKQYGYGFVYFYDAQSALQAIEHLNAQEVNGIQFECQLSYQSREQLFNKNQSSTTSATVEAPIYSMALTYNFHGVGPQRSVRMPIMAPPPPPFEQYQGFYPVASLPIQYLPSPPPGMHLPGVWMPSSPPVHHHQPMILQNQVNNMIPMLNMPNMPSIYGPSLQALSYHQYFPYQSSVPIQERPWQTFHHTEQQHQPSAPNILPRPSRSAYQAAWQSPRQSIDRRSPHSGKLPRTRLTRLEQKVQSFDFENDRVEIGQSRSTELDFVVLPSVGSIDLSASVRSMEGADNGSAASLVPDSSSSTLL